MDKSKIIKKIENPGIIPVIRLDDTNKIFPLLEALIKGGVTCAELTTTIPNAINLLASCRERYAEHITIGMGTILTKDQAEAAISAGAEFLISPLLAFEALQMAQQHEVPFMMGALSPTEIYQAKQAGSNYVKIFPISKVGIKYIKDIKGPLPDVKIIPTGGICFEDIEELVKCNVSAMGVGGDLVSGKAIAENNWDTITANAEKFVASVKQFRNKYSENKR